MLHRIGILGFWIALTLVLCTAAPSKAATADADRDGAQLVVLVRHAEKGGEPADDPALTAPGTARAATLAKLLSTMRIGAVITTEWRRTRDTAAPLAAAAAIVPTVVDTRAAKGDAHAQAVVDAVRAQPAKAVLVVGHSNTVPAIVAALGGPKDLAIADEEYDHLYLLWREHGEVRFLHTRY